MIAIFFITANLFIVYGTLFLGWKAFPFSLFYLMTEAIFGLFATLKIAVSTRVDGQSLPIPIQSVVGEGQPSKFALVSFYLSRFYALLGMFFLFATIAFGLTFIPFDPLEIGNLFFQVFILALPYLLALTLEFIVLFVNEREYEVLTGENQILLSFLHVLVVSILVIAGAFLFVTHNFDNLYLYFTVGAKTIYDLVWLFFFKKTLLKGKN